MTKDDNTEPDWKKVLNLRMPGQYTAASVNAAVNVALVAFKRGHIASGELQRAALDVLKLFEAAEIWTKERERLTLFPSWLSDSDRED